jgi:hypothetical protein
VTVSFIGGGRKLEYTEKTTNLPQVTDKHFLFYFMVFFNLRICKRKKEEIKHISYPIRVFK